MTDAPREDLERELRLAYEPSFFRASDLYQAVSAWEDTNPPYRVLPRAG